MLGINKKKRQRANETKQNIVALNLHILIIILNVTVYTLLKDRNYQNGKTKPTNMIFTKKIFLNITMPIY